MVIACLATAIAICTSGFELYLGGQRPVAPLGPHYEAIAFVKEVIDGDTLDIQIKKLDRSREGIAEGAEERLRLAGVDAPESYETGYNVAKEILHKLCPPGTTVYLDFDDLAKSRSGRPYRDLTGAERLLAVVYIRSGNRWVNVNAEVLRRGTRALPGHDWLKYAGLASEFNPYKWLRE